MFVLTEQQLPRIGLGTCFATGQEMYHATKHAIKCGYRHIDLAPKYGNEKEIGQAIAECIADGSVTREELILTSKLYHTCHQPSQVRKQLMQTLKDLQLDYLDYYLMHAPWAFKPKDENVISCDPFEDKFGAVVDNVDYLDTWKAMLKNEDLVRNFGVSNFNSKFIYRLIKETGYTPKINQIECHLLLQQQDLLEFCRSKGIQLQAYAPLGEMKVTNDDGVHIRNDSKLLKIADKHQATVCQVMLRFHYERGICTIPKSKTPARIEENFSSIKNLELDSEDWQILKEMNSNKRFFKFGWLAKASPENYPFGDDTF